MHWGLFQIHVIRKRWMLFYDITYHNSQTRCLLKDYINYVYIYTTVQKFGVIQTILCLP